jgi:hypothetical protein
MKQIPAIILSAAAICAAAPAAIALPIPQLYGLSKGAPNPDVGTYAIEYHPASSIREFDTLFVKQLAVFGTAASDDETVAAKPHRGCGPIRDSNGRYATVCGP